MISVIYLGLRMQHSQKKRLLRIMKKLHSIFFYQIIYYIVEIYMGLQ